MSTGDHPNEPAPAQGQETTSKYSIAQYWQAQYFDSLWGRKGNFLSTRPGDSGEGAPFKPGKYHVFIDESADRSGNIIVIGAVLIPVELMDTIDAEVTAWRNALGSEMKKEKYPVYTDDLDKVKKYFSRTAAERLRSGDLPEIHTQQLWQSDGQFKIKATPRAMSRRNRWLYQLSNFFIRHPILVAVQRLDRKFKKFQTYRYDYLKTIMGDNLTSDINTQKIKDTLGDMELRILFELFVRLDYFGEVGIQIASVTCDRGKRKDLFGKFAGFERARRYGYWRNFPDPSFAESHLSSGLQLADFASYVFMRGHHHDRTQDPLKSVNKRILDRIIHPKTTIPTGQQHSVVPVPRDIDALFIAMHIESAVLHNGGMARTYQQRLDGVERECHKLFTEFGGRKLVEAEVASYDGPVGEQHTP